MNPDVLPFANCLDALCEGESDGEREGAFDLPRDLVGEPGPSAYISSSNLLSGKGG